MNNKNFNGQDPMKLMLKIAAILAVIVAVVGVAYALTSTTGLLQQSAVKAEQARIDQEDARVQDEFRASQAAKATNESAQTTTAPSQPKEENHQTWSAELDGSVWTVVDQGSAGLENTRTETAYRADLINGGLLLVNAWHSLPSDFSDEALVSVSAASNKTIQVKDNTVKLFQPAVDALAEALAAAKEAGLDYYIVQEGYRSVAEQETLFNAKMEKLSSRYVGDELIEQTKKQVNYPGTSDYHTGMSFRMDVWQKGNTELNNKKFQAETEQAAWLTANCWKYGIIFRFPTKNFPNSSWMDKSYITGVSASLNLYRYVGKAHATAMKVMDLCLEEYLEFLEEHPHICIYQDGTLMYEVVRLNGVGNLQSVNIPVVNAAISYQASEDNLGGVVIAYTYQ